MLHWLAAMGAGPWGAATARTAREARVAIFNPENMFERVWWFGLSKKEFKVKDWKDRTMYSNRELGKQEAFLEGLYTPKSVVFRETDLFRVRRNDCGLFSKTTKSVPIVSTRLCILTSVVESRAEPIGKCKLK